MPSESSSESTTALTPRAGPFDQARIDAARAKLELSGFTIKAWAAEQGHSYRLVNKILNNDPRLRCLYGESAKIARKLGLRDYAASAASNV
jgi:gp16 family phage-associated protein